MSLLLNDVHSQLNPTRVACLRQPVTVDELRARVREAAAQGLKISLAGGRHAMGGQQFAEGSMHIDMTALCRVVETDAERGLLHIEAGAEWPAIIAASHGMRSSTGVQWGIRQKQTGVDAVSIGGSVSVNAHGRGLLMRPLGDDVERLVLMNAEGDILTCDRQENAELFSLVIGGYGLFGIICSVTLRLAPRQRVERLVDIIDIDDAVNAVFRRADEGCLYGDFQFAIDGRAPGFLRRGVFACYKPVEEEEGDSGQSADLAADVWLRLLKLAHEDKSEAFRQYARHYLASDGNRYWSDTMQLSTYIPGYAEYLAGEMSHQSVAGIKETLVIGEHYVPRGRLLDFMGAARAILSTGGTEVIYGTIRAIRRDTVSFLPWAREDFACVIFNLRTAHTKDGIQRTAETFRALIDSSSDLGGSFFLTYHRFATAAQIERCYPRIREWFALKKRHDPAELFSSDWYVHYRDAFASQGADA
jgi:FAD/FMN-containing dehydrogenase